MSSDSRASREGSARSSTLVPSVSLVFGSEEYWKQYERDRIEATNVLRVRAALKGYVVDESYKGGIYLLCCHNSQFNSTHTVATWALYEAYKRLLGDP
jgi:hypothetical protein